MQMSIIKQGIGAADAAAHAHAHPTHNAPGMAVAACCVGVPAAAARQLHRQFHRIYLARSTHAAHATRSCVPMCWAITYRGVISVVLVGVLGTNRLLFTLVPDGKKLRKKNRRDPEPRARDQPGQKSRTN